MVEAARRGTESGVPDEFGRGLCALVLDDERGIVEGLRELLESYGFEVHTAGTIAEARACFEEHDFDLALLDRLLPDGSGLALAEAIVAEGRDCEVLTMTGYASVESAVAAMRLGIADYLVKPFQHLDDVITRLQRVVRHQRIRRQNSLLLQELHERNEELQTLAVRDSLTGLFNHAYFQASIDREISRSARYGREFSVVFVDVDRFKQVNDSLGHPAGDRVLQRMAGILSGRDPTAAHPFQLREQDVAARYGGDEFILLLPETTRAGAAAKAELLRASVESCAFGHGIPPVTLSLGVASFPSDGVTRDELLSAADTALYAAKSLGRNRRVAYAPSLRPHISASERDALDQGRVGALDRTIADRRFHFAYQPIVDAKSQKVFAYEGFCRPTEPLFLSPGALFEAAHRSGRFVELARLLRSGVAAPLASMPPDCALFVNLHPQELEDPALLELAPTLRPFCDRVVFEVNEAAAIRDFDRTRETLVALRGLGFRIALDDLGAGYTGLHALAQLEPDFVKLDMSFLRDGGAGGRGARLLRHLLEYAREEGIRVIAEGVETADEWRLARDFGLPLLQGYYFGRPGPTFEG